MGKTYLVREFFDDKICFELTGIHRARLREHLEHFWNSYGSKQKDLVLIVCGSAASWMIQHIMDSKGGLHNRVTGHIRLLPFSLRNHGIP